MIRRILFLTTASPLFLLLSGCGTNAVTPFPATPSTPTITAATSANVIKHVVVIVGVGTSFDHYFGTYPSAANQPDDGNVFTASASTETPANLVSQHLTTSNPNLNILNGAGATDPWRLSPREIAIAAQQDSYSAKQAAFDDYKLDLFPLELGVGDSVALADATGVPAIGATTGLTMSYYDGNTVTGLWNYAQHYALNDHSFATTFASATPGALNLVSGQTNGVVKATNAGSAVIGDGNGGFTAIGDADPANDICASTTANLSMSGKNIGDLLNAANVTWGFFEGGFDLTVTNADGSTGCGRTTTSAVTKIRTADYVPGHQPFQYYASTANPNHLRPTAAIGASDQANHQYDMHDFTDALAAGNMPAVSFLQAQGYADGNAASSNPFDEQAFLINTINAVEKSSFWSSTAVILTWDDSGGWYDQGSHLANGSATTVDGFTSPGVCISGGAANALAGVNPATLHAQGRCGYGARLPLLVISPWAKKDGLDETVTDQTSVLRFIEDTFLASTRIGGGSFDSIAGPLTNMFNFTNAAVAPNPNVVVLNPATGEVTSGN